MRVPDITLMLDRLMCQLFGHPGPHPMDVLVQKALAPWARPACRRCGTRLPRPKELHRG